MAAFSHACAIHFARPESACLSSSSKAGKSRPRAARARYLIRLTSLPYHSDRARGRRELQRDGSPQYETLAVPATQLIPLTVGSAIKPCAALKIPLKPVWHQNRDRCAHTCMPHHDRVALDALIDSESTYVPGSMRMVAASGAAANAALMVTKCAVGPTVSTTGCMAHMLLMSACRLLVKCT